MNRDALVDVCETRFRDTDNDIYTATEWANYLKFAEADVYTAHPLWPFHENINTSFTITGGTRGTALATDALRVNSVYNATNDYPLSPISGRSDHLHLFPDAADTPGQPTHYRLRGSTLEVYPRPPADVTLEVEYMVAPATMASGAAEPAFPEVYHHMLVSGALAYAYADDGNLQQAGVHQARFDSLLQRMEIDLLGTRQESYHQLPDIW